MTANWSKSNRSWRGRDRQRLGLAKSGGLLGQVFDGEHPRTAAVAALLLASLHLYIAGLFQRHVPEPYMVRVPTMHVAPGRRPESFGVKGGGGKATHTIMQLRTRMPTAALVPASHTLRPRAC